MVSGGAPASGVTQAQSESREGNSVGVGAVSGRRSFQGTAGPSRRLGFLLTSRGSSQGSSDVFKVEF